MLIFALPILSGCKKKGKANFTIKGVISDETFSTSLGNAEVYIYELKAGANQMTEIGHTVTNSLGEYSFTFSRNTAESYYLTTSKHLYFDVEETIYFSDLTIEEDNIRNFSTTAKSWVRLKFFNQSPSATDVFQYNRQKGKIDCSICCPNGLNYLYGTVDTSIYCINDGNTIYQYQYLVQGTTNAGIKSVTTVAFDTTEIFLQY